MSEVQLPADENLLLSAYRAVMGGQKRDANELVTEYEQHFSSVIPPSPNSRPVFERFSLADSKVRLVIKSDTASI
jgi:hypothetical protein